MHFNKITVTSNTTNFLNSDMKIEVLWNFTPCQLIVSGNLEMHSTSVFRVKLSKTVITFLWNTGNYLPIDIAQCPRKFESSSKPMWEIQILHISFMLISNMATEIWDSCHNTLMAKGQKCGLQLINTEKQHPNHSVNLPDCFCYWVGSFGDAYSDTDKAP